MEEKKKMKVIDLQEIGRLIWGRRKLFLKVWGITFVLACLWIALAFRSVWKKAYALPSEE